MNKVHHQQTKKRSTLWWSRNVACGVVKTWQSIHIHTVLARPLHLITPNWGKFANTKRHQLYNKTTFFREHRLGSLSIFSSIQSSGDYHLPYTQAQNAGKETSRKVAHRSGPLKKQTIGSFTKRLRYIISTPLALMSLNHELLDWLHKPICHSVRHSLGAWRKPLL